MKQPPRGAAAWGSRRLFYLAGGTLAARRG